VAALGFALGAHALGQTPAGSVERLADGFRVPVTGGVLRLQVKNASIVRVTFAKTADFKGDPLVVVGPGDNGTSAALNPFKPGGATKILAADVKWDVASTSTRVTLTTDLLSVRVNLPDGAVTFADKSGRTILAESPGAHGMTPATVQGESTFNVQQRWQANADESLYGLGQRQEGKLDIKGYDLDLWQRNMVVAVPFLVSSRGYGLLWDNTSFTKFGDIRPFEPIPASNLVDAQGNAGGLSQGTLSRGTDELQNAQPAPAIAIGRGGGGGGRGAPPPMRAWVGEVIAPVTGEYQFQTYTNGDIKVWLDRKLAIDHWRQNWATEYDQFKVRLEAGKRYPIKITNSTGNMLRVAWKTPNPSPDTSLWSEVGEGIDYYFVYGPEADQVIAGYRALTGQATMLPRWAFGFWQSKNKYETQQEVLNTLAEFRKRQIPIDNIVQDWQYWRADDWGSHQFDAARFPDPDAMIRAIHDQHARFMISVWGKFYPTTDNFKALQAINGLYLTTFNNGTRDWLNRNYVFYDVFNAPARKMFWEQVNRALFSKGVDAWWMDATEPDLVQPSPPTLETLRRDVDRTAIGTASRMMSAYPLMNSEAVYDGQRSVAPDQRVFILTRSGFAGIQRYATVTWSGDITSTWTSLRKQITAGLGFSISGTPYWASDTGGYTMEPRFSQAKSGDALDEWRELNARWFQFSTFCPLLRVHGADRPREMWNIGDESTPAYQSELKYDRLRYALFPYIYALSGAVTADGYTLMRPLVMDFRADMKSRDVVDQFMFGPALLVSPVTEYKGRSRSVYLPAGAAWYDFWTGKRSDGGQSVTVDAPYDQIPLHVRAGSIVPFGPDQQYVGEKDAKALTLYVYAGANGRFTLYEDDGLTYGYEQGRASRIPITWNDQARTLTVGARTGTFPGMLSDRTFNVIFVSPTTPIGYQPAAVGRAVTYSGQQVQVRF
jgi:alpha-D-xyloside xylohydrolase